jgi:acyl-CoA thioesterase-2
MHVTLQRLIEILRPEKVGEGVFEAGHLREGLGHLFGGQVLAQGCRAANQVLGDGFTHSLHAVFLRRGNTTDPVRFEVKGLRASRSFATAQVTALQEGAPILHMVVSHHANQESGLTHQIPMDAVGPPQGEAYEQALLRAMTPNASEDEDTPFELPVEIIGVGGVGLFSTDVKPPQARFWLRVRGDLPDDPPLHQALFAYASDYAIMAPALNPHPVTVTSLQSASLDHAVWFHRPFRMDEWLLLELDSPVASGARGIGRGLLYTREGELVASCVQEGLIRPLAERREG